VGLVHRDIKPANLMLCRRGGMADQVKVLDFGLVKAVDSQANAITAANVVMGTPNYMSPESFEHPDAVDARSDVYALAAVGYFLLAGQPPFTGQSAIEICMHHVKTPPERPTDRIKLPLADDLQDVLLKGLAKKPEDRYASALDFAEALGKCDAAGTWTDRQAIVWWEAHAAGMTGTRPAHVGGATGTAKLHQEATMEMAK
jgi:serine/threonine-protein kinase